MSRCVVMGLFTALLVSGCGKQSPSPTRVAAAPVVAIHVDAGGFNPSRVELPTGQTSVVEFVRMAEDGCVTEVVFPESGIRHALPLNVPIRVSVLVEPGKEIAFTCPMDMYHGSMGTRGDVPDNDDPFAIFVDAKGFHPDRIRVPAGEATVLRFTRVAEKTCNTSVVIPSLSIRQELPLNETVEVTIPATASGEIPFACPMDMAKGIIEATGGSPE